jgi:hypothetical protein
LQIVFISFLLDNDHYPETPAEKPAPGGEQQQQVMELARRACAFVCWQLTQNHLAAVAKKDQSAGSGAGGDQGLSPEELHSLVRVLTNVLAKLVARCPCPPPSGTTEKANKEEEEEEQLTLFTRVFCFVFFLNLNK